MDKNFKISKKDMEYCAEVIAPYIHRTPVLSSSLINEKMGTEIYFKCENFQKTGAYKMRGATNAILSLSEDERKYGVTTHSSGNFAQAVAKAAQSLGIKAYIVMPSSAPKIKVAGVKQYGGEVIICEPTLEAREKNTAQIVAQKNATFLHPSNNIRVITGQGTAAMELLTDHPDLDCLICPIGGGGLIAGSLLAAHYFSNNCKVYGIEPKAANDAYRSLLSGQIEGNESTYTIADGLKTQLGNNNFPIIKKLVKEILLVTEEEIIQAMRMIWESMKIIIEPSSSVCLAALIKNKEKFSEQKIGIILSGGNVDFNAQFDYYQGLVDSFPTSSKNN